MTARDDLLSETRRQVKKKKQALERTKAALIQEIREGAKELQLFEELKKLRRAKDRRMENVIRMTEH